MGVVDKLLNVMKLSDMEDEYDGEDYYDDDEPVENIKKAPVIHREDTYEDEKPAKKVSQKVTPIRSVKRAPGPVIDVNGEFPCNCFAAVGLYDHFAD